MYSIKAISNQTGIQAETIRTWERRYNLLSPVRDESGRRVYSDEDVAKLGLIASLVRAGHPVRHLAKMDDQALKLLFSQASRTVRLPQEQQLVDDLADAIHAADLVKFRLLLGYTLSLNNPVSAVEHVLVPTWRRIGTLWTEGEIGVGLEHALSEIMKQEVFVVMRSLQRIPKGPKLVFSTLGGELHEFGSLLGCYIAASEGFACEYWGPNLPATYLIDAVEQLDASAVILSFVCCFEPEQYRNELELIAERLPSKIDMCIGTHTDVLEMLSPLPGRAHLFRSFEPFHDYLLSKI